MLFEPDDLSTDSVLAPLEVLMHRRKPLEGPNTVALVRDMPVDGGGFGHIRLGRLNDELVSIVPYPIMPPLMNSV
jgi:hypothetical protein